MLCLGLSLWLAAAAFQALSAQTPEAALRGRAVDGEGHPLADAAVSLRKAPGGQAVVRITSADGTYAFPALEPGADYELRADRDIVASRIWPVRVASPAEKISIDLKLLPPIRFQDVAPRAGLNFTVRNGATGHLYQPEIMLGGVAAFDYNNDGCMDIFFTNGAALPSFDKSDPEFHNRLFRNNCNMTFTDVTGNAGLAGSGYSMGVGAGDFDNDGFEDLLVTGLNGIALYRNRGDGTFDDVTRRAGLSQPDPKYGRMWSVSAGWFDYDNDGFLDLFVTNYVAWSPETEVACSDATKPFYCHPRVYKPLPDQLFHNNGDGTFTDVSESSGIRHSLGKGMGVAFGDFNGDGRPDIFVANDSLPNFLFENLGGGKFREVALERGVAYGFHGNAVAGMGADFRDLFDTGRDDIVLDAMYYDTFPLYRNRGQPNYFTDETIASGLAVATRNLTGWGLGAFDFDNDGHKDLFFATSHFPGSEPGIHEKAEIPNHVLRNTWNGPGNGRFEDVSAGAGADFQLPALYHGAAFADFDNDGRVDAVVTAVNSHARLYRNVSPAEAHWIALSLVGTRSNRDGIGARVRLTLPTGAALYNKAGTSVGYASSSEPLVRFGLGPYQTAREIEIRWPSGSVQVLRNIGADRMLVVREP